MDPLECLGEWAQGGFSGIDAMSTKDVVFYKNFWTESVGFPKEVHKSWKIPGIFSGLLRKNYC